MFFSEIPHVFTDRYKSLWNGVGTGNLTLVPGLTQGRFDLTPGNRACNARAEYTRSLPNFHQGYFTAVVSAGKWRQNDDLIPCTTIPNITLANVTLLSGGAWDTTGALSRKSAAATIDTRLADLTFSVNPTTDLNLKAKARYNGTKNNTDPFLAVNPNAVYVAAGAATAGNGIRRSFTLGPLCAGSRIVSWGGATSGAVPIVRTCAQWEKRTRRIRSVVNCHGRPGIRPFIIPPMSNFW